MKREHIIRMMAGIFVLIGLLLHRYVHPYWLLLPAFVGVNLIQSAITKWCLMERILTRLGIGTS